MWNLPREELLFMGGEFGRSGNGTMMPSRIGICSMTRRIEGSNGWYVT